MLAKGSLRGCAQENDEASQFGCCCMLRRRCKHLFLGGRCLVYSAEISRFFILSKKICVCFTVLFFVRGWNSQKEHKVGARIVHKVLLASTGLFLNHKNVVNRTSGQGYSANHWSVKIRFAQLQKDDWRSWLFASVER